MLPDRKALLFTNVFELIGTANSQIVVQSLKSGERKLLIKGSHAWLGAMLHDALFKMLFRVD
jgi:hypothetical protein